jgi:hypothetical protein
MGVSETQRSAAILLRGKKEIYRIPLCSVVTGRYPSQVMGLVSLFTI